MSNFKPNKDQAEYIGERNKNILVSASAGSGKTSSMVEKIVDIIDSGVSLEHMLIVTYTVASANEMKQKLYHSISEKMRECDDEKREYFLGQLEKLNNCDIGTIHSFCKKVITKYFYVIDQDLNYGILENNDYLYNLAVKNVFKKYVVNGDQNFFTLYESYNKKRDEKILINLIKTLHNFFASKISPDDWKEKVLDECYNKDVDKNICAKYVIECFKERVLSVKNSLIGLKNIYVSDKMYACIDSRICFCDEIINVVDFNKMLKVVGYEITRKEPTTKLGCEYSEWVKKYEEVMAQFAKLRDDIKKLEDYRFSSEDILSIRSLIKTLFEVVQEIKIKYDELKKDKGFLDFADLEHKCYEILSKDENVCSELRDTYEYIFVDEYQDINQLQEGIISLIKNQNNLNLIGDIKQSIYAFRLATPKLFIEKYNDYPNDKNSRVIMFNENWRSENSILQFVNEICDNVITKNTIGVDYKSDARLQYPQVKEKGGCSVEIDILNKPKTRSFDDDEEDKNYLRKEALLIAKKIKDICNMSYKNGDNDVKYKFGDIAIILRKKGEFMQEIINVLKEYNIPCNASYKLDIFDNHAVQVLYSVLKLLNNSDDDLACAIVLKNIFDFDEKQLIAVKKLSKSSLSVACQEYLSNFNDDISTKLKQYYSFLSDLQFKLTYQTLYEVIKDVCDKHLVSEFLRKTSDENRVCVDNFLSLIDNNLYKYDIKSCIDYLVDLEGNKRDVCFDASDGVQITTIHSSKGLEYKAVIFAGLGQRLSINLNTQDIAVSDNFGVGLQYLDVENRIRRECVVKKACLMDNEREEVNEELRLLYVALTRGMKYLVLTGAYPIDDIVENKSKNIYQCRRYFDWIFMALSDLDRKKFEGSNCFYVFEGKDSVAKVCVDNFDIETTQKPSLVFGDSDKRVENAIRQNLAWKYPFVLHKNISIKNSVSSILKESVDYENSVDAFKELTLGEKITPSLSIEKGNAYHKVMQSVEFDKNCDLAQIIKNCGASNLVDLKKIERCVEKIKCFATNAKVCKEAQFIMKVAHNQIVQDGVDQKILVQGVVDLYIDDGDGITLIDYKTNKVSNLEKLATMYSTQMRLYALALEKATNKKVKNIYLYSFDKDKLVDMKPYINLKN